ncbi:hypothetical protein G6F57_001714 [Rhizopus arrhizus]|nr:hypothetical protein G6F30_001368 [Rhizopus arrhizus]KAG1420566.1 hypothetical protein G6F58_004129 [Rhizopus delemar]KAG0989510.1 hypothetical protein G6F29_000951 [Rhizopus arrhizus]KAG0999205.1 hypothetical protein G6F28_001236 [Rhizopus arrhizus]KAG1013220.1 hypothetical protein G6F27_002091 [Rhizopus arrhizus]
MRNNNNKMVSCTYRFIDSSIPHNPHIKHELIIRQQPERAKEYFMNEIKRPIEPPPILQLNWLNCHEEEEEKKYLQNPSYFIVVNIVSANTPWVILPSQEYLSGTITSSLYRLNDLNSTDGGFFIFNDLIIKKQGEFKLHFSLFEITDGVTVNRKTILSNQFTAYPLKEYPGALEPTILSRSFMDQGIKMRARKEHSSCTNQYKRKAGPPSNLLKDISILSPSYASDIAHFGRWKPTNSQKRKRTSNSPMLQPSLDHSSSSSSSSSPTPSPTLSFHSEKLSSPSVLEHKDILLPPLRDSNCGLSISFLPIDKTFFMR